MKILKHTLLAVAAVSMLTACNDDGYWSQYNTPEEYYAFPNDYVETSFDGSNVPATYDVVVLRSEAGDEVTVPVSAVFSDNAISGPSSITFAKGSREAIYSISINSSIAPGEYEAQLELPYVETTYGKSDVDETSDLYRPNAIPVEGNTVCSVVIIRDYTFSIAAGSAQVQSLWWMENETPVTVEIQKASDYAGPGQLFRLYSLYHKLGDPNDGKDNSFQFYVDDSGAALALPSMQLTEIPYGSYTLGWAYRPTAAGNRSMFVSDGNAYMAVVQLAGFSDGSLAGYFGAYEQLYWEWTEGYPF